MWGAALAEMVRPVWVLPVKLITGTSGDLTSVSPASRPPVKTFTTPCGSSGVCEMISAIRAFTWAVWRGSITAAVQPAASAGASERITSATGEFHGAMIPATPTG